MGYKSEIGCRSYRFYWQVLRSIRVVNFEYVSVKDLTEIESRKFREW